MVSTQKSRGVSRLFRGNHTSRAAKAEVGVSELSRAAQRVLDRSLASLTYVSRVSQSVTSQGGVRSLEEGKKDLGTMTFGQLP